MKTSDPLILINKVLKKRQSENSQNSLRNLAAKMRISPGYLSKILQGKKALTKELIAGFCEFLRVDDLQKNAVLQAFEQSILKQKVGKVSESKTRKSAHLDDFELATSDSEWILSKWYYTAVLDLITCKDFQADPKWIGERLQISTAQAAESLEVLSRTGLVVKDKTTDQLEKKHKKIRFPTKLSKEVIRSYHESQMKRAIRVLEHQQSQADFNSRLIVGLSVATNMKNIEMAKNLLHAALYEAAQILSEGEATELFQINLQLFPQTKLKKS